MTRYLADLIFFMYFCIMIHRLSTYFILLLLIITAYIMCGCSRADNRPVLTVSIEPQRYLLEKIVGDKWQVNTLLEKGADPENFDPSISALRKASDSRAYFRIGNMAFEDVVTDRISATDDILTFDTSEGITLLKGTHHSSDGHDEHETHSHDIDPHIWSSVANARIIASNMYRDMLEIDPDNKDYYTANFNRLTSELDSLDSELRLMLAPLAGHAFIVWHPSLSYFAADYGLEQIALGMDHKEMSAMEMRSNIDKARSHSASVMFVQPDFDSSRSQEIAAQAGATAVMINPLGYDWPDEMRKIARALTANTDNNER